MRDTRTVNYDFWDGKVIGLWFVDDSVDAYDVHASIVTLVHSAYRVQVDLSILINDLFFSLGDWINVVGYLEEAEQGAWNVKAVMVWPVSPGFNLIQYEDTIKSRMETTM